MRRLNHPTVAFLIVAALAVVADLVPSADEPPKLVRMGGAPRLSGSPEATRAGAWLRAFNTGDADTMAAITGGIAEAYYGGVPDDIRHAALRHLDERLRTVCDEFEAQFGSRYRR